VESFFDPSGETEKRFHNLPHWQQQETWVFVTWRLADSLPKARLAILEQQQAIWLRHHPKPWDRETETAYHERPSSRIDEWLDVGSGSCLLRDPENGRIVADALHHFDGARYRLSSYVVMPNHVHALFAPGTGHSLGETVHSWKRHTARLVNAREGRSGPLWQADYWDRLIRSPKHFEWVRGYISRNPLKLPSGSFVLWNRQET